jgi:hypothetical protein
MDCRPIDLGDGNDVAAYSIRLAWSRPANTRRPPAAWRT